MLTLSVFLEGVLAGVFLCSAMVEQAERALPAPEWIAYKQAKERLFGPVMPAFFGVTLVVAIIAGLVPHVRMGQGASVLLLAIALAITVLVHLPLNREFQTWSASSFPAQWSEGRSRWRNWNWLRCVCAVGAFAVSLSLIG
ncbi:DUF1772 domain-containing protein [Aurantimonas sp. MSK8Z-1]|uniref:DUF1772 domain-containing protein n=1 Tax=Mangrovibrevibacter kandeliae TaxID=2968473 RepID=UPI002117CBBC|nr:DUF1772 domain-containing protein [Aurantimonas sp. MSK8Z-1]MCW4116393.1 DUF1772 domain-containing protein [Aurantimonas sp. MSK8Z-1]